MREADALNETFREILRREEALRRLSVTAEAHQLAPEANDFVRYCIGSSHNVTDIAEREWLHGSLAYWFAVAYSDGPMPGLRLKEPTEGYTFRVRLDRQPGEVCVESLYRNTARPAHRPAPWSLRTFGFALTSLAYVGAVAFFLIDRHLVTAALDSLALAFTRPSQLAFAERGLVLVGVGAGYVGLSLGLEGAVGRRHSRTPNIRSLSTLVILIVLVFLVGTVSSP